MTAVAPAVSLYEIALLGHISAEERDILRTTLSALIADFGLVVGSDVRFLDGASVAGRNPVASFAASYFGGGVQPDQEAATVLHRASLPIIPVVAANQTFEQAIPALLAGANGLRRRADDPHMKVLAVALLECVGLLRIQRRVFVSYRRTESRSAAVQLHDLLGSRGFDVFLDTHDIRPGEVFQDTLWHRLCDSDVMVMLDTPTYFESKWTRQELGRAKAKEIQVLRVVWPDREPTSQTDFAETIYLDDAELSGTDGPIVDATADKIVFAVESLRSRSIAARYMSITGKLRAEVEKIGGSIRGIGAHRAISIVIPGGRELWAYPVVGVPTAELFNDIAVKAKAADQNGTPVLVFDHIGIRSAWMSHLKWLDEHITAVKAIKVAEAGWELAEW